MTTGLVARDGFSDAEPGAGIAIGVGVVARALGAAVPGSSSPNGAEQPPRTAVALRAATSVAARRLVLRSVMVVSFRRGPA